MPTYCYVCKTCNYTFDLYQTFEDKPKVKCPECGKHKLYRDCSHVHAFIKNEPKTLEHLAARNTKKMGKYEYEARLEHEKNRRKKKKPKEIPFWREGAVKGELLTATPKEKTEYIEKGIMPPNRIQEFKEAKKEQKAKNARDKKKS